MPEAWLGAFAVCTGCRKGCCKSQTWPEASRGRGAKLRPAALGEDLQRFWVAHACTLAVGTWKWRRLCFCKGIKNGKTEFFGFGGFDELRKHLGAAGEKGPAELSCVGLFGAAGQRNTMALWGLGLRFGSGYGQPNPAPGGFWCLPYIGQFRRKGLIRFKAVCLQLSLGRADLQS